MNNQTIKSTKLTGCCEPFNPKPWQDKEITWKDKIFVKDHVTSFLHIPLNMGKKVIKNMELIEKANAKALQQLMLTDEKSLWGADIYIEVSKDVPGAQMAKLSGTFLTKVFEGPYQNAGKWAQDMKKYVENKDDIKKNVFFLHYLPEMCQSIQKKLCGAFRENKIMKKIIICYSRTGTTKKVGLELV